MDQPMRKLGSAFLDESSQEREHIYVIGLRQVKTFAMMQPDDNNGEDGFQFETKFYRNKNYAKNVIYRLCSM